MSSTADPSAGLSGEGRGSPTPGAGPPGLDADSPAPGTDLPRRGAGPPGEGSEHLEHRQERVRVETPRHRIEGSMILARDGYRSRVSDVLNASERDFLTLTDVILEPLDGGPVERHDFLAVARAHIVFAVSAPEEAAPPPAAQVQSS